MRRRTGVILAVVVVALLAVGIGAVTFATRSSNLVAAPPPKPAAAFTYDPAVGAAGVNPTAPVSVRVANGTLNDVALRDAQGKTVEGTLADDRTSWTASGRLTYGAHYTWSGTATGEDGNAAPLQGTFDTDDRTVGVAAPIQIQFDGHVDDRAAVERALTVETSTPVEGAWGWLPDENGGSRIHYRTKEYWPANTKVKVSAKLFGVDYGGGVYGRTDISSSFTIGRSQIVKADANSHRLIVMRDG